MLIHSDTAYECDGKTDGQNCCQRSTVAYESVGSNGKKLDNYKFYQSINYQYAVINKS